MSAIESPRIRLPYQGEITGARKVLRDRMTAMGFSYEDLAKQIGRNKGYLQEFVTQGTPRRLHEEDRAKLAVLLKIAPEALRDDPAPMLPPDPEPAMSRVPHPAAGRLVPLYYEGDPLDPTSARNWAQPFYSNFGPAAGAIAITTPICGRVVQGDVCYFKSDLPVTPGDLMVLMREEDSTVAALGQMLAIDSRSVTIATSSTSRGRKHDRNGCRLLKIVGTVHP